ncbi:MAG: outer membrane beta-barrel protein [Prevotellaceae bacterium]|nr:outer membrane beta-barrel protein [Prevotellaceae bacterium]
MRSKYIFAILLSGFLSFCAYAQNDKTIVGSLADEISKAPVESAAVRLLRANDSAFVKGSGSNSKGEFSLSGVSAGRYIVHVSLLGYKDVYQPINLSSSQTTSRLGLILLSHRDEELQEAVVTGKASEVLVNNDTVEYNAASFKTPANSVIEDLLKRFPGAEVDKDGKITVNGKEIKKILVEGKEFFSDDPKVASKNIPAEMVKTVQVFERRTDMARMTGFDDGGEETVINLIAYEGMKKGLMINAMAGAGRDAPKNGEARYEAAGMMNQMSDANRFTLMARTNNTNNMGASDLGGQRFGGMRGMRRGSGGINEATEFAFGMNREFSPKLSLNADVSYNTSDRKAKRKVETETFLNQTTNWLERQITDNEDVSNNFGLNMRLDWKPDTSNTFIFRPNVSYNKSTSYENQRFEGFESFAGISGDTLYSGNADSKNAGEGFNLGGTAEYSHRFRKQGRVLSLSLTGSYNNSYSQGDSYWNKGIYANNVFNRDSIVNQHPENDNLTTTLRTFVSYVEPLGHNNFVQLAYRYSKYDTESVNSTYDLSQRRDTARLNGNQSRSVLRKATEQRISLKFKSIRAKFNYTIGLNIDPSASVNKTLQPSYADLTELIMTEDGRRLPNLVGDSIVPGGLLEQNVINISPELNFNYLFDRRTNLRVDYAGTMNQPSAKQLADYEDYSNPMNVVRGNPNLKPSYSNRLSARFSKSVPEKQLFYTVDLQGNLSFNDIVTVTTINPSDRSKNTTYANVNGNWNLRLMSMFNTPLKNKKLTVGNFLMAYYSKAKGYAGGELNSTKSFSTTDRGNINYRSTLFDLGINGSITYQNVNNMLQPENSRNTFDWGLGGSTAWYLPWNITLDADVEWSARSGYTEDFNTRQTLLNASITKQLFNKKYGVGSLKFKMYDVLQQRKSMNYTVGNGYTQNIESTTLPSFFMLSFIYRINIFPSRSSATPDDLMPQYPGGGRGGRGGQGGQGGGGRFRF